MTDTPSAPAARIRHLVASGLLVATILTLTVLLVVKHASADPGSATPAPTPSRPLFSAPPSPLPTAPDRGTVRVTESGYENIRDVAGEPQADWGVVVTNTSHTATAAVTLALSFLDRKGKEISAEGFYRTATLTAVPPGQRAGTGDAAYLTASTVARFRVRVAAVRWWPASTRYPTRAPLTVDHVSTAWTGKGESVPYWGSRGVGSYRNERGDLTVSFRVTSRYPTLLTEPAATVVFRDRKGRIVGGGSDVALVGELTYPPGWSEQSVRVKYGPPHDVDVARTEVYAYPATKWSVGW